MVFTGGFITRLCRRFDSIERTQMNKAIVVAYRSQPSLVAGVPVHTTNARTVFLQKAVTYVLSGGSRSEIGPSVIQRVVVSMVDDKTSRITHDLPVHKHSFGFVLEASARRVERFGVCVPYSKPMQV